MALWSRVRTIREMAALAVILLCLCGPAAADFKGSNGWFDGLTDEDRIALQTDLTLAGFYDALVDGAFGPTTYRALTNFQAWHGTAPTGVLGDNERTALRRAADSVVAELDLQVVHDERAQLELVVPRAILQQTQESSVGTSYLAPDSGMRLETILVENDVQAFDSLYRQLSEGNARRRITYQTYQEGYFVVSGAVDGVFFYTLMLAGDRASVGYTLNWTQAYAKQGSIVSLFLASFVSPWSEDTTAESPVAPVAPAALPASSSGATVEIGNFLIFNDMPGVIGMRGEIGPSTPLDFRRAIRAVENPRVLMLASEGGLVSSALLLAYEVRELGLATYVLPETGCYSACSFVFFAGVQRKADGALGVHQVWGDNADASTAQVVVSDILEAFVDFGVRQEVTSAMLRTQPQDMYVFSGTELDQWGINAGDPMATLPSATDSQLEPPVKFGSGSGVSVQPKTSEQAAAEVRTIQVWQGNTLAAVLGREGVSDAQTSAIVQVVREGGHRTYLLAGTALKILMGPSSEGHMLPYRIAVHSGGPDGPISFGVALTDGGQYRLLSEADSPPSPGNGKGPRRAEDSAPAYVQLAVHRTEAEARGTAQQIANRFGPLFGGANLEVQRVDLGARGVFYRVRAHASSAADAASLCDRIKDAGGDCFVM